MRGPADRRPRSFGPVSSFRHNWRVAVSVSSRRAHMHRWLPAVAARARTILVLTGHSLWRGVVGIANSDDLTHAASIAYYALLSPVSVHAARPVGDRADHRRRGIPQQDAGLRAPVFPDAVRFRHHPDRYVPADAPADRRGRRPGADLGVARCLRRDHHGGESRLGRGEAAEFPQTPHGVVPDAAGSGSNPVADGDPVQRGRGGRDERGLRRSSSGSPGCWPSRGSPCATPRR